MSRWVWLFLQEERGRDGAPVRGPSLCDLALVLPSSPPTGARIARPGCERIRGPWVGIREWQSPRDCSQTVGRMSAYTLCPQGHGSLALMAFPERSVVSEVNITAPADSLGVQFPLTLPMIPSPAPVLGVIPSSRPPTGCEE